MREAVERNSADLLAYFNRRIDQIDDASDLLGDTMVAVWRRIADLPRDETRARMWMFGVARRILANYRRGRTRQNDLAARLRDAVAVDDEIREFHNAHEDIWAAVRALPAPQREVILLVHGDGFTVTEAARLMSASPSTTRTRYSVALKSLQASLREYSPT